MDQPNELYKFFDLVFKFLIAWAPAFVSMACIKYIFFSQSTNDIEIELRKIYLEVGSIERSLDRIATAVERKI